MKKHSDFTAVNFIKWLNKDLYSGFKFITMILIVLESEFKFS